MAATFSTSPILPDEAVGERSIAKTRLEAILRFWDHPARPACRTLAFRAPTLFPIALSLVVSHNFQPSFGFARGVAGRLRAGAICVAIAFCGYGCQQLSQQTVSALPARHSIQTDHLLVLSDFRIERDHGLVSDLKALREQVESTLELPTQRDPVVVYLFENEERYQSYLNDTWPNLPPRRAYFVGTPSELAVYSFWGERVQEDLRHEYTHGILHSCLTDVPLWLDEGLAEYFELPGNRPGAINADYARRLAEDHCQWLETGSESTGGARRVFRDAAR